MVFVRSKFTIASQVFMLLLLLMLWLMLFMTWNTRAEQSRMCWAHQKNEKREETRSENSILAAVESFNQQQKPTHYMHVSGSISKLNTFDANATAPVNKRTAMATCISQIYIHIFFCCFHSSFSSHHHTFFSLASQHSRCARFNINKCILSHSIGWAICNAAIEWNVLAILIRKRAKRQRKKSKQKSLAVHDTLCWCWCK